MAVGIVTGILIGIFIMLVLEVLEVFEPPRDAPEQ